MKRLPIVGFIIVPLILVPSEILCAFPDVIAPPYELSEDGRLSFPKIANKYGYPAEETFIITEDGYNLTMHRIPGDRQRPVLLVHGNLLTSDCWISRGNISIAITLAKEGYDVFAINMRGSTYSRRHVSIDPDKDPRRFFNYSFYEQAIYDVASAIDFVLQETEQTQLVAIGFSLGTTVLYVLGAERPEYNDKINLAVSLAPVCFVKNQIGILALPEVLQNLLYGFLGLINIEEIFNHETSTGFTQLFCIHPLGYELCIKNFLFPSLGYDEEGFEPEFTKTFFADYPGGSSRKIFQHLHQVKYRDQFAKYDYGKADNMKMYGTEDPPVFDLGKVTMKSALFVGRLDRMATVADVRRLRASLPNVVHYQLMPYKHFTHMDFAYGRYMTRNLYPYLLPLIKRYTETIP